MLQASTTFSEILSAAVIICSASPINTFLETDFKSVAIMRSKIDLKYLTL